MAQGPTQYTPAQILEAGQRAEADGRVEYASQFYHHLIDHYPQAPEARIAREGVERLSQRRAPEPSAPRDTAPYFQTNNPIMPGGRDDPPTGGGFRAPQSGLQSGPHSGSHSGQRPDGPGFAHSGINGFDRAGASDAQRSREPMREAGPRLQHGPPISGPGGGPLAAEPPQRVQIAPAGYEQGGYEDDEELPEPRRQYRLGRFVAGLLLVAGLIMVLAGAAFVVGPMAVKLDVVPGVSPMVVGIAGIGIVFLGLLLCLVAQLARAVFDGAEAARATAEWQAAAASRARTRH